MTPEESFIIDALKRDGRGERLPSNGLDYRKVLDISARHSIKPLLHKKTQSLSNLPAEFVKNLADSYNSTLARNMFLWSRLTSILEAFESAGVPVIVLKGIHLSEDYYLDLGLRPMVDIDLLVPKEDSQRAGEILAKLGYSIPPNYDATFALKYRSHIPYVSDHRITHSVEVHWTLTQDIRFNMKLDDVWASAESYEIDGIPCKVMSHCRLLPYLCVHFTHHLHYPLGSFRPKLIWLYDIHLLISQGRFDWDDIAKTSRADRTGTALYVTLYLTKELLKTNIPDSILDELRPGHLRCRLLHFLLDDSSLHLRRFPNSKIACTLISELIIERMMDRLAFTVKFIGRELDQRSSTTLLTNSPGKRHTR